MLCNALYLELQLLLGSQFMLLNYSTNFYPVARLDLKFYFLFSHNKLDKVDSIEFPSI